MNEQEKAELKRLMETYSVASVLLVMEEISDREALKMSAPIDHRRMWCRTAEGLAFARDTYNSIVFG